MILFTNTQLGRFFNRRSTQLQSKKIFGTFCKSFHSLRQATILYVQATCPKAYLLESVQDFLIKLDMKPWMHLVEISIFSLNLVIVLLTKIMKKANKNWAYFQKIKYLKNQNFQKHFLVFQSNILHRKLFSFRPFFSTEK